MSPKQRARFVALSGLMRRRFPEVDEPEELISGGLVLVDGAPVSSPRAFVRADAAIKIVRPKPLRGTAKLAHAIERFGIYVTGLVAVDLGASAGGFTKALLDAGAARVYAVDAGVGQLRGWLRADPRVVNLEGTNLGRLTDELVPECVDLSQWTFRTLLWRRRPPRSTTSSCPPGRIWSPWSSRLSSFTPAASRCSLSRWSRPPTPPSERFRARAGRSLTGRNLQCEDRGALWRYCFTPDVLVLISSPPRSHTLRDAAARGRLPGPFRCPY